MKKLAACFLAVCLLVCLAACSGGDEEAVTVEKVSRIVARGSVGLVNRYAGLVVSGDTAEVKKGDKTISEVLVKEGDWVAEGDVLFRYDMEAMELELSRMLLELDGFENTILNAEEEIPQLEKQRDAVPAAQQLSYSLQIQSLQADIREARYKKGLKEREIAAMEEALEDTDVRAPIAGRVMSVQQSDGSGVVATGMGDMGMGESGAFITIMDMTTYQIKGTINELNVGTLNEGMRVIVRSRIDENTTWSGSLDRIDWENESSSNENAYYYYGYSDEMTSTSKYPFYVTLDDVTGLILGQHVYIEPDYGQMDVREGLWLPEYYICDAWEEPWVWCAGGRSRLEKRAVTLGAYDEEAGEYEILSGLSGDDYIAFPSEELEPGMKTVRFEETLTYASGGNAFFGGFYASGGDAAETEEYEAPPEELFATEEEIAALEESMESMEIEAEGEEDDAP